MEGSAAPPTSKPLDTNGVKHLEMIQAVIGRLASNSFLVKGWAITLAAALFGFALTSEDSYVALAALVPVIAFWALDGFFLRSERLFRALYDEVRCSDQRVEPFFMGATGRAFVDRVRQRDTACDNHTAASWLRALFSLTLAVLYLGLIGASAAVAAVAGADEDPHRNKGRGHSHTLEQASLIRSAIPSSSEASS